MPGIQRPMDVACAHPISCPEEKSPKQVAKLLCDLAAKRGPMLFETPQPTVEIDKLTKQIDTVLDKTVGDHKIISDNNQSVALKDFIKDLLPYAGMLETGSPQFQALQNRIEALIKLKDQDGTSTIDSPKPVTNNPEDGSPKQLADVLCVLTAGKDNFEPGSPQKIAIENRINAVIDLAVGDKIAIGDDGQAVQYRDLITTLLDQFPKNNPKGEQAEAIFKKITSLIEQAKGNGGGCGTTDVPIPIIDDPVPRDPLKTKFPQAHPRELVKHIAQADDEPIVCIYPDRPQTTTDLSRAEKAKFKLVDVFRNNYYNFFEAKKPTSGADQVFASDPTAVQLHTDWLERELNRTSRDVPTAKAADQAE